MLKWGAVITVFYALIVVFLLAPLAVVLPSLPSDTVGHINFPYLYKQWAVWIPIAIALISQALLLFLSVDTSWRRLKPRAHILVSCLLTATLLALLTGAAILCLLFGVSKDYLVNAIGALGCWAGIWVAWIIVFYLYGRNSSALITRAISWLLKGSVLELLIAVPAHVIVRRRHDCSAPVVTSFGIITGLAIMLMSFGPSVLLLYKKRLDEYATRRSVAK
ncbi:MAG TPA: hypothetical protein VK738_06960 [Terriglobales bacterium]|jgi:hypothetical protein|nr:hypothetical protein [Terriglobales bacterium]